MLGVPLYRFVEDRVKGGFSIAPHFQCLCGVFPWFEEKKAQPHLGINARQFTLVRGLFSGRPGTGNDMDACSFVTLS